jgi:hypothetical protein
MPTKPPLSPSKALPSVAQRACFLALNAAVFALCYGVSNHYSAQLTEHGNIATIWDQQLLFLPWMIVPYLSSGLFFTACFFWTRELAALRALSLRLLFCTVLASLVFVLWPLKVHPRPPLTPGLFASLFALLGQFDQPYNQLPSLHVAYCVVIAASLRNRFHFILRALICAWLLLTALSTLFTYQHHLWDVFAGAALGCISLSLIRPKPHSLPYFPPMAWHYGLAAVVALTLAIACYMPRLGGYFALSFAFVSLAYARNQHNFLGKHQGRLPLRSIVLFAPYLLGYWLCWRLVRWRERDQPVLRQIAERLWVSRRLTQAESLQLPEPFAVIDLANELVELPKFRAENYHFFPMLDLSAIDAAMASKVIACIDAQLHAGRNVLLHCAMGYQRSHLLAQLWVSVSVEGEKK